MSKLYASSFIEKNTANFLESDVHENIDQHIFYLIQLWLLPERWSGGPRGVGIHTISEKDDPVTKIQYGRFLLEFPSHATPGDDIKAWSNTFSIEIDGKENTGLLRDEIERVLKAIILIIESGWSRMESSLNGAKTPITAYYNVNHIIRLSEKNKKDPNKLAFYLNSL